MLVSFLDTAPLVHGGGYERFLFGAAEFGVGAGHRVRLVTPGPRLGDAISYATTLQRVARNLTCHDVRRHAGGAEVLTVGPRHPRGSLSDGGVVYCKNEPQEVAYALAARRRGSPLVVGFHSAVEKAGGRTSALRNAAYASAAYRALLRRADAVHVLQGHHAAWVVERLRLPSRQVAVIGNGTDVQRFRPAEDAGAADAPFRVLFAGRLIPQKGIDTFLDAVRVVSRRAGGCVEVAVRGDGVLRPAVERAAAELASIDFAGFAGDLAAEYRRASLVVVPSRWEMFALVPLEALSSGVPVVVSDIEAFAALRGDAVTSFPAGDPTELAARIEAHAAMAAGDPDAYRRLRGQARARAVREFDGRRRYRELFELLAGVGAS